MSGESALSLPLYAQCDGCGVEGAVLARRQNENNAEHFCPACFRRSVLYDAAAEHFELLLSQALSAWLSTWRDEPYIYHCRREILECMTADVLREYVSEGVQPSQASEAAD